MTMPGTMPDSRTATVQLQANIDPYGQSVQAATHQTNALADSLDRVEARISSITRAAGRKLVNISAGDVAVMSGYAASAALYEKQLSSLNATAAITPLNMKAVKSSIEGTFTSLPTSRTQVISLTEALSNLGVTGSRDLGSLVTTFLKLSAATGEPVEGLAQGLTQLSRLMGNTSSGQIGNYANSLLTVSKNSGVSATGVLNFAQAIAPMARQAGIGEAAVLGISAAFSKAGADGYVAANTFNSIVSDITQLTQSGSPELAKYANLIGVTTAQFKSMDKTTALQDIFTTISKQGPQAINTLNRLGIDGVRAQSAIAAVVQSGGLNQAITSAVGSSGNQNNLNKASSAAMGGLTNALEVFRNQLTQLADIMGQHLLPPITGVVHGLTDMMRVVNLVAKPLAPLLDLVGALAAAFTAMGGGALLAGGLLAKLTVAGFVARSSPVAAFMGGRRTAATGVETEASRRSAGVGGKNGTTGLRWWQTGPYAAGSALGRAQSGGGSHIAGTMSGAEEMARREALGLGAVGASSYAGAHASEEVAARRPGILGRIVAAPVRGATWVVRGQTDYVGNAGRGGFNRTGGVMGWAGDQATRARSFLTGDAAGKQAERLAAAEAEVTVSTTRLAAAQTEAAAVIGAGAKEEAVAAQTVTAAARELAVSLARLELATVSTGAKTVGAGLASGVGAVGKGIWNTLGPLGVGFAGFEGYSMYTKHENANYNKTYNQADAALGSDSMISRYDAALGQTATNLAALGTSATAAATKLDNVGGQSLADTAKIGQADTAKVALGYAGDKTWNQLAKAAPKNVDAAVATLQSLGVQNGTVDSKFLDKNKDDLIKAYGAPTAQTILDKYMNSGAANAPINAQANYGALGGAARGQKSDVFNNLVGAGVLGIVSREQVAPGQDASKAALGQLLQLGGGALQGTSATGGSANVRGLQEQFAKVLGGNKGDYVLPTPGDQIPSSTFGASYGTTQASQGTVFAALANSQNGRAFLASAGVDLGQVDKLKQSGGQAQLGQTNYALNNYAAGFTGSPFPGAQQSVLGNEVTKSGALGTFAESNSTVQGAYNAPQDPAQQYAATQLLYTQAGGGKPGPGGDNTAGIIAELDTLKGAIKDTSDQLYVMAKAAKDYAQQQEQYAMPYKSRLGQLQTSVSDYNQAYTANQMSPTADTAGSLTTARTAMEQQKQAQQQYMLSVYQQAQQFGTQMERSQADQDETISRSKRDFYIQMSQMQEDYNRTTFRAERDHNIQLAQQAQSAAQTIYNPYQRVQAQYTTDAGTLVQNLGGQNDRLKMQKSELDALSKMGLSTGAIQSLNLANPDQQQQLDLLYQQAKQDPSVISQLNAATATRLTLTKNLTQNDFNLQFAQSNQQFTQGLTDAANDYNLQRTRAVEAQNRALGDMAFDFNKMVTRSGQDLTTSMTELYGSYGDVYSKTLQMINDKIMQYAPQIGATLKAQITSAQTTINSALGQNQVGVIGLNAAGAAGEYDAAGTWHPYTGYISPSESAGLTRVYSPITGHEFGGLSSKAHVASFSEGNKPEAIVPLTNAMGTNFMVQFVSQVSMAMLRTNMGKQNPGYGMGQPPAVASYSLDQSTTFTGPVTLQANNVDQLMKEIQARNRLKKLTSPTASTAGTV